MLRPNTSQEKTARFAKHAADDTCIYAPWQTKLNKQGLSWADVTGGSTSL